DLQETCVAPPTCERLARERFGLRDLALVVREDVVLAARVDVELLTEVLASHRRALDVPTRKAVRAEAALPLHQVARVALPQEEVGGVALLLVDLDARAGFEVLDAVARQLAVLGEPRDVVVDLVVDLVGVA